MITIINLYIIFKNWVRRKMVEFLYPEIKKLNDLNFVKVWESLEERYEKIGL